MYIFFSFPFFSLNWTFKTIDEKRRERFKFTLEAKQQARKAWNRREKKISKERTSAENTLIYDTINSMSMTFKALIYHLTIMILAVHWILEFLYVHY